jgi:hypothetical protein
MFCYKVRKQTKFISALEKSRDAGEDARVLLLAKALQGHTGEGVKSVSVLRASTLLPAGATKVTFKRVSEATEQAVARAIRVTL